MQVSVEVLAGKGKVLLAMALARAASYGILLLVVVAALPQLLVHQPRVGSQGLRRSPGGG
jgi:hypothetical protein